MSPSAHPLLIENAMNSCHLLLLCLLTLSTSLFATPANTTATLDSGGQRATSANYSQSSSLASIAGGVAQSANVTNKPGYIGQLYKVVGGALLQPTTLSVPETQSVQIKAFAQFDDQSLLAIPSSTLADNSVLWVSHSPSKISINQTGLAVTNAVYQNEPNVQIAAVWNGYAVELPTALTILNTNNDNFAPYDADSVDDAWQVLHFGLNDALHGRGDADADGDGTSNLLEWAAGTDPLSAGSKLGFMTTSAQANGTFQFTFSSVIGKSYHIERSTNLLSWTILTTVTATDVVTGYTDNATPAGKAFYRIEPVLVP
jgi:hypothetical protein